MRRAHQTFLARSFAVCLLLLAASPVTAPFTTCDLADFTSSQPHDTGHHPGRDMAGVNLKMSAHFATADPPDQSVLRVAFVDAESDRFVDSPHTVNRTFLHPILRL